MSRGVLGACLVCSLILLAVLNDNSVRVAAQAGTRAVEQDGVVVAGLRRLASRGRERASELGKDAGVPNITATFKGEWSKSVWTTPLDAPGALQQRNGVAVLKLRAVGEAKGGVAKVRGEMVLRDGQYATGGDVMLHVQGVHVPAAGKLVAVVDPAAAIRLTTERGSWQQAQQVMPAAHAARGKHAGSGGGHGSSLEGYGESNRLSGQGSLIPGVGSAARGEDKEEEAGAVQRQAEVLRSAARQVARLAAKMREDRGDEQSLPDPVAAFEEARRWQPCEFRLELSVGPALGPDAAWAAGAAGEGNRAQPAAGGALTLGSGVAAAHAVGRHGVAGAGQPALGAAPAPGDLLLSGALISHNCGTRLNISLATAHVQEYYNKAVNYTLMITALGLAQVLLLVRQMEACATPALASRVSLVTLAHQALLDAYLCLVHLTLGIMVESLFHSFGTIAFMQFVVFAIFEMRLLLSVWRARRGGVDPWAAQREVSVLYARFYATLLAGILLTYQLQRHMPVLLFAFFSFWWPQIVLCVRTDTRQPLKTEFVLGTSAARLALPLYVYACPSNLLRVQPRPGLCIALVAWVGLQCGLLLAQRWLGPRCFIPRAFLPRRYDYSRPVPVPRDGGDIETGDTGGRECVICMQLVDVGNKAQRAVTPCNHVFHKACLERWLTYKHDCPTCRRALPPI